MLETMAASVSATLICAIQNQHASEPRVFLGIPEQGMVCFPTPTHGFGKRKSLSSSSSHRHRFVVVVGVTQGSAESSKSDEKIPSWAKPDSDEPPPWAQDEVQNNNIASSQQGLEIPFYVYLLASAITAIAAIGSIFEYVNQRPVFGVLSSDSVFYAPLLGFFAFTGIPSSAFLWFKSVQAANKEAEEQDKRDGYL